MQTVNGRHATCATRAISVKLVHLYSIYKEATAVKFSSENLSFESSY